MTWKRWAKAPLRSLVRPLLRRIDARVGAQSQAQVSMSVGALRAEIDQTKAAVDQFNRTVPALLANVGSPGPAERELRSALDELGRRVEFVRKEVLFELRYGERSHLGDERVEPRVLNPTKLTQMAGAIRLNLGAGHVSKPEYLNVDTRELDGIDVVADVSSLPFEKGTLAAIYSAHLLEHFPLEQLRSVLLPYWVSLLAPGGQLIAVVPDMETMINEYVAGRMQFEELREVTYGTQEYEGDFHYNGFSQGSMRALLEEAGLVDVAILVAGRRNGMCYEMEVAGVRPAHPGVG